MFVEEYMKLDGLNKLIAVATKTTKSTQAIALSAVDNLLREEHKDKGLNFPSEFLDFVINLCNSQGLTTMRSALSVLMKVGSIIGFETINESMLRISKHFLIIIIFFFFFFEFN